jgi:hypothetical protein
MSVVDFSRHARTPSGRLFDMTKRPRRTPTLIEERLRKAGAPTDEHRLRMLEIEALDQTHGNVERAVPNLRRMLLGDIEALDVLIRERLFVVASGRKSEQPASKPTASPSSAADSRPDDKITRHRRGGSGPTDGQIKGGHAVEAVAKTIFDNTLTNDGRAWGDVRGYELLSMNRDGAIAARLRERLGPSLSDPENARKAIRDLVKEKDFAEIVNQATKG